MIYFHKGVMEPGDVLVMNDHLWYHETLVGILSKPGQASGCSTNTVVTNFVTIDIANWWSCIGEGLLSSRPTCYVLYFY